MTDTLQPDSLGQGPQTPPVTMDANDWWHRGIAEEAKSNLADAMSYYQAALVLDPSHLGARANLGRLQYRNPDQPFLDEVNRRARFDVSEVLIEVRNPCNYRCFYCVAAGHNNVPVKRFDFAKIESVYRQIQSKLIVTSLECGGGEPTVHPEFPTLVRLCSEFGPVSFPTNNSQNPRRWLPEDTAKRLLIRAAVHPEAEEHLDRYIENARYLIDHGCDFRSIYISHPTRLARIPEYREMFAKAKVPFTPISFLGEYNGKRYPHAYTEEEKRMIGLSEDTRGWEHKVEPHVTRIRNFRGIPCLAGYRSIYITKDGAVRRCTFDGRPLNAPLKEALPCGVKKCGCGLFLEKLNVMESVDYHNYWGQKADLAPIDTEWMEPFAEQLGYKSANDATAKEFVRRYDALMEAYGKDEFPE